MVITGPFEAFRAWVDDEPRRRADTVIYRTSGPPNSAKVVAVAFPRELMEWVFPAAETVTVRMLKENTRHSILVTSWTL